jgi:hypothetical protein
MTSDNRTSIRRRRDAAAAEIVSLLYVISIVGAVLACGFNLYVFRDWNINYFQLASVADIFMSSAYVIFAIIMLAVPSFLIWTFAGDFGVSFRKSRVKLLKRVGGLKSRRRARFFGNWVVATVMAGAYIYLVMIMVSSQDAPSGFISLPSLGELSWDKIFWFLFLAMLIGVLSVLIGKGVPSFGLALVILYGLFWSLNFVNPYTYRWYGFFGEQHIRAQGKTPKGCDAMYLRWMGESKTVLECWRNQKATEQILYVFDNQSGALYGPIKGDPAYLEPIAPRGPLPPPSDRLSPEQAKRIYGN